MDVEGDASAYEQPLEVVATRISELEAAAAQAQEALARQRSLALGMAVQKIALHHNGLGEPGTNLEGIRSKVTQLLGELGLDGIMAIDQAWPDTQPSLVNFRIDKYAMAIDMAMRDGGISLREVSKMSGVSHTQVAQVRKGAASRLATYKVAASLGLIKGEAEGSTG
jgi:hypothetical protein